VASLVREVDRSRPGVLLFIALISIFRLAYCGWFELSLDEGYYWLWSVHPALSYYDHPPMAAWIITLFGLLGESERYIRAGAVLCAAVSSYFIYLTSKEVFNDGRMGLWAAILLNLTPMFSIGAVVMTPDSPLFMFWSISAYYGVRLADTQRPGQWYAIGFFFGLAMLSKYTAALFAPALLLFLLVSQENRTWLFRREPYLAFALSTIIFLPVLVWNAQRDWVSFRFQLSHGFSGQGHGVLQTMGEFWGAQTAMAGFFLFFYIIAAAIYALVWGLRQKRDDILYLGVITLSLLAFFLANSSRTRMEGNWPATMYITAIAATPFLAARLGVMEGIGGGLLRAGYRFSVVLAAVAVAYLHVQMVEPVLPAPQKYEISRRIYGWKALAAASDLRLEQLGPGAFIVANRYQISTLLSYYTKGHREAYITNGKGRFSFLGSVAHLPGKDAVYVSETSRDDISRIGPYFERVEQSGELTITRQGELIREFRFYKCYNYRGGLIEI